MSSLNVVSVEGSIQSPSYLGVLHTREARRAFIDAWKRYLHETPSPGIFQFIVYCLLLGKPLGHAFTPITRVSKLENGQTPYGKVLRACSSLAWHLSCSESPPWLSLLGVGPVECDAIMQTARSITEASLFAERR